MTDEFADQIGKLHQHIEHVSHQVGEVKRGQDDLHKEHMQLRERVDLLERNVSRDIDNLAAHEKPLFPKMVLGDIEQGLLHHGVRPAVLLDKGLHLTPYHLSDALFIGHHLSRCNPCRRPRRK